MAQCSKDIPQSPYLPYIEQVFKPLNIKDREACEKAVQELVEYTRDAEYAAHKVKVSSAWQAYDLALLFHFHAQGIATDKIAEILKINTGAERTKGSVIGKIDRMRIGRGAEKAGELRRQNKRDASVAAHNKVTDQKDVPVVDGVQEQTKKGDVVKPSKAKKETADAQNLSESFEAVSIIDRKDNQCAWPVFEDEKGVPHCCGAPVDRSKKTGSRSSSYCTAHFNESRPVRKKTKAPTNKEKAKRALDLLDSRRGPNFN